jgi:competence protein ComEC
MWRWLRTHQFERTSLVFLLCLSFVIGIALAHSGRQIDSSWWWLSLAGIIWTIRKYRIWSIVWIIALGVSLGWWRGSFYMTKLADYQAMSHQRVTVVGRAANDAVYDKYKQLSFDVINPRIESSGKTLTGKIGVSGFGTNAVFANDEIRITAKLNPSRGGSYQAYMSFAKMEVVAHHPTFVTVARSKLVAGIQSALPEPLASFGLGLLVGQRNTLPPEVSQTLLMVGLTHIIAVSGYNLTILLRASKNLLGKRSKRQATLLSLALIAIFLLFAGQSASIVRAAIVSVLSIAALYYGRSVKPLVLIMLAAAITAYAKPYYIWTDVSWYLSFLAFFGVMVLAPLVIRRLPTRLHESLVANVAIESLCAELMTLPYVLHIFGQMSFIGLVSNILVVAFIPLAMLLSLVAGIAGMVVPAFAGWFAWPAQLLLTYMLDIATLLSRIPHVFVQNLALSLAQLIILYSSLAGFTYVLYRRSRLRYATITDRNNAEAEGETR